MSQLSTNTLLKTPWQPTRLSGLQLWLDGVDVNANQTIFADGATVNNWQDKSGLGRNANVQATGSRVYNYFNGAVQFGPTGNARLEIANAAGINLGTTSSKLWAFVFRTAGDFSQIRGVYEQGGGTNCFACYTFTDGNLYIGYSNGGAPVFYFSFPVQVNTDYIAILNFDTTTIHRASLNGVAQENFSSQVLNQHTGDIAVGAFGGNVRIHDGSNTNTNFTHARHYELLIYNQSFTVAEVQQMEGYLAWKWNMVNLLPAAHPYRGQRPL